MNRQMKITYTDVYRNKHIDTYTRKTRKYVKQIFVFFYNTSVAKWKRMSLLSRESPSNIFLSLSFPHFSFHFTIFKYLSWYGNMLARSLKILWSERDWWCQDKAHGLFYPGDSRSCFVDSSVTHLVTHQWPFLHPDDSVYRSCFVDSSGTQFVTRLELICDFHFTLALLTHLWFFSHTDDSSPHTRFMDSSVTHLWLTWNLDMALLLPWWLTHSHCNDSYVILFSHRWLTPSHPLCWLLRDSSLTHPYSKKSQSLLTGQGHVYIRSVMSTKLLGSNPLVFSFQSDEWWSELIHWMFIKRKKQHIHILIYHPCI